MRERGWLVAYVILLPHTLALFRVSLTQTAGYKMAALMGHVFMTFRCESLTNRTRNHAKHCCVFLSIPLLSTGAMMLFQFSSPLTVQVFFYALLLGSPLTVQVCIYALLLSSPLTVHVYIDAFLLTSPLTVQVCIDAFSPQFPFNCAGLHWCFSPQFPFNCAGLHWYFFS